MRENECTNLAIFGQICCKFAFARAQQTKGKATVGIGHFVGHGGTVRFQKWAISFCWHSNTHFLELWTILLASHLHAYALASATRRLLAKRQEVWGVMGICGKLWGMMGDDGE